MRRALSLIAGAVLLVGLVAAVPLLGAERHWEPKGPGQPLWAGVSESVVNADHCGWHDITVLSVKIIDHTSGVYARDVDGQMGTSPPFDAHATLPPDAIFTGWRKGSQELWAVANVERRGAPVSIYIVSPDDVERWSLGMGCV